MYDLMPEITRDDVKFDDDVYMANVFASKNNCSVRFIGIETVDADTTVDYSIYLLEEDSKSPTDGHLVYEKQTTFPYAGYHRIDLGRSLPMANGNRYSIVARASVNGKSAVYFNHAETMEGFAAYYGARQARFMDHALPGDNFSVDQLYSKGVVNKGESYIGNGSEWADWADVTAELKKLNADAGIDYFTYDNFPIRSYPETELFTAGNFNTEEKTEYHAGDEIKARAVFTNNSKNDFAGDMSVELIVMIGAENKELSVGRFSGLKAGESEVFDYTYTVNEEDVKAGKVTSSLKIRINGKDTDYDPVFGEILTFCVDTAANENSDPVEEIITKPSEPVASNHTGGTASVSSGGSSSDSGPAPSGSSPAAENSNDPSAADSGNGEEPKQGTQDTAPSSDNTGKALTETNPPTGSNETAALFIIACLSLTAMITARKRS